MVLNIKKFKIVKNIINMREFTYYQEVIIQLLFYYIFKSSIKFILAIKFY